MHTIDGITVPTFGSMREINQYLNNPQQALCNIEYQFILNNITDYIPGDYQRCDPNDYIQLNVSGEDVWFKSDATHEQIRTWIERRYPGNTIQLSDNTSEIFIIEKDPDNVVTYPQIEATSPASAPPADEDCLVTQQQYLFLNTTHLPRWNMCYILINYEEYHLIVDQDGNIHRVTKDYHQIAQINTPVHPSENRLPTGSGQSDLAITDYTFETNHPVKAVIYATYDIFTSVKGWITCCLVGFNLGNMILAIPGEDADQLISIAVDYEYFLQYATNQGVKSYKNTDNIKLFQAVYYCNLLHCIIGYTDNHVVLFRDTNHNIVTVERKEIFCPTIDVQRCKHLSANKHFMEESVVDLNQVFNAHIQNINITSVRHDKSTNTQ